MTSPELKRPEVIYPESDGKPMGETDLHRKLIVDLIEAADHRFLEDPDVYVTGDLLLYYEEGDPTKVIVPDVFVVRGLEKKLRRTYKLWEEKKAPDVVVEVSSRSTHVEDKGNKKVIYENLGVREYFLFDPEGKWLRPPLQGYRLVGSVLEPVAARRTDEGALVLFSEVLGLELRAEGSALRWVDPRTGEPLPTPPELHAVAVSEKKRAESEKKRAEREKKRAESEKKRAEREKERAESEKERAESEKERAEREKERAESEKKRAESEKERAESEKRRADAAEAELARLREQLERQRGSRKGSG